MTSISCIKGERSGSNLQFHVLKGTSSSATRTRSWTTQERSRGPGRIFGARRTVPHSESYSVSVSNGMEIVVTLPWSILEEDEASTILYVFLRQVTEHGFGDGIYLAQSVAPQLVHNLLKGDSVVLGLVGSNFKCLENDADFKHGVSQLLGAQEKSVQHCDMYV